jgi:hypothetical protein
MTEIQRSRLNDRSKVKQGMESEMQMLDLRDLWPEGQGKDQSSAKQKNQSYLKPG